ncbi:MAG: hypothetical protein E7040_09885 [Lentisphaerae bacterium]|nr:hypothetical protein [Lentisphaerota bacterium]
MRNLFHESFETVTNGLPGGWYVENNSNLKAVPAIRKGDKCIELLSAGNKFLPVIPDVSDCTVKCVLSFDFSMTKNDFEGGFAYITSFRYDTITGRGQAVRMRRNQKNETVVYEYGTVRRNIFTMSTSQEFPVADAELDKPFEIQMTIRGTTLTVDSFGQSVSFEIVPGKGKVAIAREHFFDVLKILSFDIETDEELSAGKKAAFTIPLSEEPTYYPLFCDVELEDYGNCMEASLSLRGGVRETPIGEGTYHGRRMDLLTNPYLKVITPESCTKHIVYNDRIVMIPEGLSDEFFYKVLAKKVDWPFKRNVRFLKPAGAFDLAFGFDSFVQVQNRDFAETPSETVFDLNGNVLYSGLGISEKNKMELLSRSDKEMLKRLPESDPRYDKAVQFVKDNHFFFENEAPEFKVRLTGKNLPESFRMVLQDAFLSPVRELKYTMERTTVKYGVSEYSQYILTVEDLSGLACGVWHIQFDSTDSSVEEMSKLWAFEVMSREEGALPPPLISGIPYLYDSRTETRGLITDAFDPWKGKSANAPHYISCANFLPPAAKKYQVFSTVKAYGRENFLWLEPRCTDTHKIEDNLDSIAQTDYVNIAEEIVQKPLTWRYSYRGFVLKTLIEFVKMKKDPNFPLEEMEKWLAEDVKSQLDEKTMIYLVDTYWEEWLDFANKACHENKKSILEELRKTNPKLKFSQYGPGNIYAANFKGPEFARYIQNENATNDVNGFWQFEDYPFACRYDLSSGSYYLTSCLLQFPGGRFYPEIYVDGGVAGCPDGAVYYAHPPFGQRPVSYPQRMTKNVYEFCYGSAHYADDGFHYWENCGFQACRFFLKWYETLLRSWRVVKDNRPVKPVCKMAFVSSKASLRAARETQFHINYPMYRIVDVRNTASEDVPYIAKSCRMQGLSAGFQIFEENVQKLTSDDVSVVVLPPLKGMAEATLKHLRKLHAEGVSLIGCEDVTGMEDIFGVKDSGCRKNVTWIYGTENFMAGQKEFCDDERCTGRWAADGAEVLLSAEIPVLTIKRNGAASAVFFNVPPHLVKEDQLHDRYASSKDSISDFMQKSVAEVLAMVSNPLVRIHGDGRILANYTENGDIIMPVYNPSDKNVLTAVIEIDKSLCDGKRVTSDVPVTCLEEGKYRLRLEPDASAYLIIS